MATIDENSPPPIPGSSEEAEYRPDLNQIVICPDCRDNPPNLVEEFSSGDLVCGTCGLVVDTHLIDTRSEWRTFANDDHGNEDPSRVGDTINPLLNGSQLETNIAFSDSKAGRDLSRIQNKSQQDKGTKNLVQAYRHIGSLCDAFHAGKNVADSAKYIYKLVEDEKFLKGKPQEAIIAGCIFIACRQLHVPRTFREIYDITQVSKKEIGRVFKLLQDFLKKLEERNKKQQGFMGVSKFDAAASTTPQALCARFCSNLGFRNAQHVENLACRLADQTPGVAELAGRSPLSIAAACIYMASHLIGDERTSKDIAIASGVSDGTIKTAYRFLYLKRESLVDKSWANWIPGGDVKAAVDRLPVN